MAENTCFQTFPYNHGLVLYFSNEKRTALPGIEVGTSELIWYIYEYSVCTSGGHCFCGTSVSTLSVLHGVIVSMVHPWVLCTSRGDCFYGTAMSTLSVLHRVTVSMVHPWVLCTSRDDCFYGTSVSTLYFTRWLFCFVVCKKLLLCCFSRSPIIVTYSWRWISCEYCHCSSIGAYLTTLPLLLLCNVGGGWVNEYVVLVEW